MQHVRFKDSNILDIRMGKDTQWQNYSKSCSAMSVSDEIDFKAKHTDSERFFHIDKFMKRT